MRRIGGHALHHDDVHELRADLCPNMAALGTVGHVHQVVDGSPSKPS